MKRIAIALLFLIGFTSCDRDTDYVVTIHTSLGDITAILYDETPLHKENFLKLAKAGRYDSTFFHRVIKDFMIQGGDIDAKEGTRPSEKIPAEINSKYFHKKGALAAARQGDNVNPKKMSSWCQFYIVHGRKFTKEQYEAQTVDQRALQKAFQQLLQYESQEQLTKRYTELYEKRDFASLNQLITDNIGLAEEVTGINIRRETSEEKQQAYSTIGGAPHLDEAYTVFGEVIQGLEVVDLIADKQVGAGDKPLKDIPMTIEVKEMKKKQITKKYGYVYPSE